MSDLYQLTNSTTDFKSRANDIFDKLSNLEKQHDVHTKTQTPVLVPDDDTPSSSNQNPTIPSHAITFKKRPADDSFTRPSEKWKKYDLDDVNEHQTSGVANRHALNDFLRTRVKPSTTKEDEPPSEPVFKRPLPKKAILSNEDDDDDQFISIRAPVSTSTTTTDKNDNDEDETAGYKLKSSRTKPRGVLSTNEKKPIKSSMEISEEKDPDDNEEDEDDIDDELFEP